MPILYDDDGNEIRSKNAAPAAPPTPVYDDDGNLIGGPMAAVTASAVEGGMPPLPPPPAPVGKRGALLEPETYTGFAKGIYKGAASTGTGIMKTGLGAATGDFGPFDTPGVEEEIQAGLTPNTTAESVGKGLEQIAEFMAPGGLVNKTIAGAGLIQKMNKGKRLAQALFAGTVEGAADAGVTLAQTGGDLEAAGVSGVMGGATRGLLSLPAAVKDWKSSRELLELANEFKIPLTKGQQLQDNIRLMFEGLTRSSGTGGRTMAQFDLRQNEKLAEAASRQIIDISRAMPDKEAGEFIQGALDAADRQARKDYAVVVDDILSRTGQTQLEVAVDSPLQQRAVELYDSLSQPFMEGATDVVDDIRKAKSILHKFVDPDKVVDSGVLDMSGKPIIRKETKELTFEEAKEIRTLMFKIADSQEVSIGAGAIKQMNAALDDEIGAALERAGFGADAQLFRATSAKFRKTRELLEEKVIEQISKSGTPETILDSLLRPGAETRASTLRKLLHKDKMEKVKEALWRRMLEPPTEAETGVFMGTRLKHTLDKLSPGAKEAIFGKDPKLIAKIERFATLADKLAIPKNTVQKVELGRQTSLSSQLGARAFVGGAAAVGARTILGMDDEGSWKLWLAGGVMMAVTPAVFSKMITRPGVVDDLTKALTADPLTSKGKQLAARIAAYVGKEMGNGGTEDLEKKRKDATAEMHSWLRGETKTNPAAGMPPLPE